MSTPLRRSVRRASLTAAAIAVIASTLGPAASTSAAVPVTAVASGSHHAPRTDRPAPEFVTGQTDAAEEGHSHSESLKAPQLPPLTADKSALRRRVDQSEPKSPHSRPSMKLSTAKGAAGATAAAACSSSNFVSQSGSALVALVKASPVDCINSLFSVTGSTGRSIFSESQMTSVAYALRDVSASYPGNSSTGSTQLVLFLRAGYYVQYYNPTEVGSYGASLGTAIRSALDAFFGSARSWDVTDANGETLSEAVTLIDSSGENARYLYVVKRLLNGYNSSYNASWWMLNAVNNVYMVLFRGHYVPEFVSTVQSDRSVLDTLYQFANRNMALLSTDQSYLVSNAGRELGRFLQHASMQSTVRPLVSGLLSQSSITGTTAALWVGVAEMTDYYDKANCAYYDTCNLAQRLISTVLKSNYTCSASIKILAQDLTAAQLSTACQSMVKQDAYFHSVVRDNGPVANDRNSTIEVVVFDSSTDYQTYAGAMYGIDTNNGGMYLEGDPAAAGNQPRFIAYEAEWVKPTFQIWNLNHEYTHYLDGRFNMAGDFTANISTPTIWWIEGFAEYISYSYRNVTYTDAMTQAGLQTYTLRQLFDTDYNSGQTLVYNWGYLAVRFMITQHWSDTNTVLGYYRSGNWSAARSYLTSTIGTRYDGEFRTWLQACAAGSCPGGGSTPTTTPTSTPTSTPTTTAPGNQAPTAQFTVSTNALTASFTDGSTDTDGTIASRRWEFGDGTTSTATNPSKTYSAAGTYTVKLTVTDNGGKTATASQQVTVASSGGVAECAGSDTRALGKNCKRSDRSAATGEGDMMYIYVPAGTARLTITTTGGSGDVDLYYSPYGWAMPDYYTASSVRSGNSERIVVNNPDSGYVYITLQGRSAFSGVTVQTSY